jgi:type IV pilus assembly protein PilV
MDAMSETAHERGTTLLEVLVTTVVVTLGLLGLAGLQSRMQLAEMESYQRAQALLLLNDMASRIAVNRSNAAEYAASAPPPAGLGQGACPAGVASRADVDAVAWCQALRGAAETVGGSSFGAMLGGRGCVENLPNNEFLVTVAWQGLTPIEAPPANVTCGRNLYDDADTPCTGDRCRRVVTTVVRIAALN